MRVLEMLERLGSVGRLCNPMVPGASTLEDRRIYTSARARPCEELARAESTAPHSARDQRQAPFSPARGNFKTLFVLELPLSIRWTR